MDLLEDIASKASLVVSELGDVIYSRGSFLNGIVRTSCWRYRFIDGGLSIEEKGSTIQGIKTSALNIRYDGRDVFSSVAARKYRPGAWEKTLDAFYKAAIERRDARHMTRASQS